MPWWLIILDIGALWLFSEIVFAIIKIIKDWVSK